MGKVTLKGPEGLNKTFTGNSGGEYTITDGRLIGEIAVADIPTSLWGLGVEVEPAPAANQELPLE